MRGRRRIGEQQLAPAGGLDLFRIPPGFGEDEPQLLHRPMLRPGHRLGPGKRGQRFVPVPRRQQPGQVLPEPPPLRQTAEQSSNRAAYPSSGPGAAGHGRRRVIARPPGMSRHHSPAYRGPDKLPVAWHGQFAASAERFLLLDDVRSHRLMPARCRLGGPPSVTQLLSGPEPDPPGISRSSLVPVRAGAQLARRVGVRPPGPHTSG
jgi:hypothetical protein